MRRATPFDEAQSQFQQSMAELQGLALREMKKVEVTAPYATVGLACKLT